MVARRRARMTAHDAREGGRIGNAWMETRRVQNHAASFDINGIRPLAHPRREASAARSIAKHEAALVLRSDTRAPAAVCGRTQRVSSSRDILGCDEEARGRASRRGAIVR